MNQVPHIKKNFWNLAISEKPIMYDVANRALELQYAAEANAEQEQYITSEEARKLGAGKAEWQDASGAWHKCEEKCAYYKAWNDLIIKYRAIKQPAPVEPKICTIKNLDTGIISTMTQEAAKKLQAKLGDTVEWVNPFGQKSTQLMYKDLTFDCDGVYTYKPKAKPLKQVSWASLPVGVMTNKGELRKVIYTSHVNGARMQVEVNRNNLTANASEFYSAKELELAPATEQPWIAVQDEFIAIEGLIYTCRYGLRDGVATNDTVLAFKVAGLAEGYELK